jgi:hypothetical protein
MKSAHSGSALLVASEAVVCHCGSGPARCGTANPFGCQEKGNVLEFSHKRGCAPSPRARSPDVGRAER